MCDEALQFSGVSQTQLRHRSWLGSMLARPAPLFAMSRQ